RRRVRAGEFGALRVVVVAVQRDGVDVAPTHLVEAAIAHDRREPGERLAFRGRIRAGVVPDADVGFLQDLLGEGSFTDYTQRDRVQMRRRAPVELRERALVGERGAGEELAQPRVARRGCRVSHVRRACAGAWPWPRAAA